MKTLLLAIVVTALAAQAALAAEEAVKSIEVGTYPQEVKSFYTSTDGLPSNEVLALAVASGKTVYAGTSQGLARLDEGAWRAVDGMTGAPVSLVAAGQAGGKDVVAALFRGNVAVLDGPALPLPGGVNESQCHALAVAEDGTLYLATDKGLWLGREGSFSAAEDLNDALGDQKQVNAVAVSGTNVAVGAVSGLFLLSGGVPQQLFPRQDVRSWAPTDVRAVAFDTQGDLWFASLQGAGKRSGNSWTLYTGDEGLPYNDFTCMAVANGGIWFGTGIGAIRYDGEHWAYRQGRRWLPNDAVTALAVNADGEAWLGTPEGISHIGFRPMTLAEKADFYENEIDKYNRRTEFGYVLEASAAEAGSKDKIIQHDSDNDGLWTAMYGAGECFAYGATKDAKAKERAKAAFEALRFLGEVTRGGSNPAPPGFVARTILPTSGPNPNAEEYTPERDRQKQRGDALWKVVDPRWPTDESGEWYWKSDTSSDELDGHYFLYSVYYDLVADTEEEKARVREHVAALTDHLLEHDFNLVDHDGKPTRWAIYSPSQVNQNSDWFMERGLNSLSILSYLAVAEHITGDSKYREAADYLIKEHSYAQNTLVPKIHNGAGSGNHSDDEMAFMCYYTLLGYEDDPDLRSIYGLSLFRYWRQEEPEMNPFFNFVFASRAIGLSFTSAFGTYEFHPKDDDWLTDSVEQLKRFPLDRFDWGHKNAHRIDIVPLREQVYLFEADDFAGKGYRVNGKVIPVDETFFNHYNYDPWNLNTGGGGRSLADGTVFLLPYYMGLYHGYIE